MLCYRRSFWARHRFPSTDVGEDSRFVWQARPGEMVALPDADLNVCIAHDRNVSPKQPGPPPWR
jgi:hypothetical protein